MYSTCSFCHRRFARNDAIERFPVGRRLAFDAAKARLWVVCATCQQWNLSPLEVRWEAIEEAERAFRATRLRTSTDQVGLARLRDGTELVRIGKPLRPEFAAWRYGARFRSRWWKEAAFGALSLSAMAVAGPIGGASLGALPYLALRALQIRFAHGKFAAVLTRKGGQRLEIGYGAAARSRIEPSRSSAEGFRLLIPIESKAFTYTGIDSGATSHSRLLLEGTEALEAARQFLPKLNLGGGLGFSVRKAVRILESEGSIAGTFRLAASRQKGRSWINGTEGLERLSTPTRLALEMAAHEELERRALEGELALLENAWKEAEAIAAIADSLTLPDRVRSEWQRLKGS